MQELLQKQKTLYEAGAAPYEGRSQLVPWPEEWHLTAPHADDATYHGFLKRLEGTARRLQGITNTAARRKAAIASDVALVEAIIKRNPNLSLIAGKVPKAPADEVYARLAKERYINVKDKKEFEKIAVGFIAERLERDLIKPVKPDDPIMLSDLLAYLRETQAFKDSPWKPASLLNDALGAGLLQDYLGKAKRKLKHQRGKGGEGRAVPGPAAAPPAGAKTSSIKPTVAPPGAARAHLQAEADLEEEDGTSSEEEELDARSGLFPMGHF